MTHLGGDGIWLVREPSGRVRALMAAGRAGAHARRELYRDYETIPPRGVLAALTVPAAVAGWMLALEVARAYGGRFRPGDLLSPAVVPAQKSTLPPRRPALLTDPEPHLTHSPPGLSPAFLL